MYPPHLRRRCVVEGEHGVLSGGLQRCPAAHGMAYSVLCSLASLREHRRRESLTDLSREIRACDARVNVGPSFMFFNGNLKSGMKNKSYPSVKPGTKSMKQKFDFKPGPPLKCVGSNAHIKWSC